MTYISDTDSDGLSPGEVTRRNILKMLSVGAGVASIGGTVSAAASDDYWTVFS